MHTTSGLVNVSSMIMRPMPVACCVQIQRYEDVIDSLKRLLEAERKRTKQARTAHTAELAQRSELQAILRQCVEDVREKKKRVESGGGVATARGPSNSGSASPATANAPGTSVYTGSSGFSRPLSATMPRSIPRPMSGRVSGSGAASNGFVHTGAFSGAGAGPQSAVTLSNSMKRPSSAVGRMQNRPLSARAQSGPPDMPEPFALSQDERELLVQELTNKEEVLKVGPGRHL